MLQQGYVDVPGGPHHAMPPSQIFKLKPGVEMNYATKNWQMEEQKRKGNISNL